MGPAAFSLQPKIDLATNAKQVAAHVNMKDYLLGSSGLQDRSVAGTPRLPGQT